MTLDTILLGTLLTLGFNCSIWLFHYTKLLGLRPVFDLSRSELVSIFSLAGIGYLSQLVNLLNYRLDFWVLEHYQGAYDVGIYSLAANIAMLMGMITAPVIQVLQPILNDPNVKNAEEKFTIYSRLHFTILLGVGMVIFVLADFVVPFVYGAEFELSAKYLKILLIGVLFSSCAKVFAILVFKYGLIKFNFVATLIGFAFTIVLDFTLIPALGALGAGIATNIVYFIIFLVVFLVVLFKIKMPLRNYFIFMPGDLKRLTSQTE